jgi:protein-arginine kinase activator protein McsA
MDKERIMKIESHYCKTCATETNHVIVLVRKTNRNTSKFMEFLTGFITSRAVGPFLAAMDEFERHRVCERCGTKEIEE